jgi:hypothetical protein
MGRKAEGEKHPAVVARRAREISKHDDDELLNIPGWKSFTPLMKRSLAVVPWCSTDVEVARMVNSQPEYIRDMKSKNYLFKRAYEFRKEGVSHIVKQIGAEQVGLAMNWLNYYLDPESEVDDRTRMQAIDKVMKFNNMDGNDAKPVIQNNTMISFPGAKSVSAPTIEVDYDDGANK